MTEKENMLDIIIIGSGPAGLTAGLYAARDRYKCLLIEKGMPGGLLGNVGWIENYPGFPEGITGFDLAQKMSEQAGKYGLETAYGEVTGLSVDGNTKVVTTTTGVYHALAVIIAAGAMQQKLNVPGEEEFNGRGVSYCATCDGAFFRDKKVAVVGGSDVAVSEAMHLTRFASSVKIIHRRDILQASQIAREKAEAEPKIEIIPNSTVARVEGGQVVEKIILRNVKTKEESPLEMDGVFVVGLSGRKPNTGFLGGLLTLSNTGAIITNEKMETSVAGVYAAGDVRQNSAWQVVSATGDGATAEIYAGKYISGLKK